jgi:DNA-binding transcriptional regulator YhcF (GntR family)
MKACLAGGDLTGVAARLGNVLETVTVPAHPEIAALKAAMLGAWREASLMSGSGPTVFWFGRQPSSGGRDRRRITKLDVRLGAVTETRGDWREKMERRLPPIKLDSYRPLREVVSEALREAITTGILKPGERLMEIQMAEELGVSRTPVREAIRRLELEGFLVMVPRRGTYVSDLSIKDINEVFEIRTALDVLAAGLAADGSPRKSSSRWNVCLSKSANILITAKRTKLSTPTVSSTIFFIGRAATTGLSGS